MFLLLYTQFSININMMFLIIGNISFMLGVAMSLIYGAKSDEKQINQAEDRDEYVSKRNVNTLLSIVNGICFLILLFLPKYTNELYYKGEEMEDKETVILMIYLIYLVVGLLYVISFLVGSCNQQQTPTEDEIELDSDDDGWDTSEDEEDDGLIEGADN